MREVNVDAQVTGERLVLAELLALSKVMFAAARREILQQSFHLPSSPSRGAVLELGCPR